MKWHLALIPLLSCPKALKLPNPWSLLRIGKSPLILHHFFLVLLKLPLFLLQFPELLLSLPSEKRIWGLPFNPFRKTVSERSVLPEDCNVSVALQGWQN